MRVCKGKKGFSLVELLAVIVVVAFLLLLVSLAALAEIDKARETAAAAETRSVYMAGQAALLEYKASGAIASDVEYEQGLTGVFNNPLRPKQTNLSERLYSLLAPGVITALDDGTATIAFTIENGEISRLVFTKGSGRNRYITTYEQGIYTTIRADGDS